ncbi:TPA: hypothetical protein ACIFCT_001538 [Acinetobacter baumannii]|uniref:hypothetical protein n=1 Tax=Acinetobacter baumannii TaxID=470 RepID=UPI001FF34E73|nr:hypothetical protein [Acinetobacter baumannii]MCQ1027391.1 hypothetical protein [Acinetobacter baumannii]MCW1610434.1 hypothetical protein [Acinetobacter baumannii]MCX3020324.1 hypothetical protein [Acinetobacter baumannii]MDA5013075.1 hypothetical protein [Acinetobacter baumannii]MDI7722760.1 hypothetical protein [Acinetobacter baumannii]
MAIMIVGLVLVALSVYRGISLGRDLEGSSVTQLSNSMYIQEMVITQIKQAWYCIVVLPEQP